MQSPPTYPEQRRAPVPVWVWLLIGCGACSLLGVIPILAAIMFPVFARARDKAQTSSCMSNQKMLSLGVIMYTQDFDETFPIAARWMDGTFPYVKDWKDYRCPLVPQAPENYGYAFNSDLSVQPLASLASPRTFQMLFDSSNLSLNASDKMTTLPDPPRHEAGRSNIISFADGHVSRVPDPYAQSDGSAR